MYTRTYTQTHKQRLDTLQMRWRNVNIMRCNLRQSKSGRRRTSSSGCANASGEQRKWEAKKSTQRYRYTRISKRKRYTHTHTVACRWREETKNWNTLTAKAVVVVVVLVVVCCICFCCFLALFHFSASLGRAGVAGCALLRCAKGSCKNKT